MAKFDLSVELKNLEGQTLQVMQDAPDKDENGNELPLKQIALTASNAIIKALIADLPTNINDSTELKNNKYQVAKKIKEADSARAAALADLKDGEAIDATSYYVSLKSEEVTLIKEQIGKLWGVMTVGALISILEAE